MSALLKRAMGEALAANLRGVLPPGLQITVGPAVAADGEEQARFPSVRVLPQKFSFMPWQERELVDTFPDDLVYQVGTFEGTVELRASGRSPEERELVQDAVTDAFFQRPGAPGVVIAYLPPLPVSRQAVMYSAPVAFELSDEDWREELVFAKRRYAFLTLDAQYPALVDRKVPTIKELVLAWDFSIEEPPVIDHEVLVNSDGSTTPTNL